MFKKQILPIIFSLMIGILSVLPAVLFIYTLGNKYQGIDILKSSDEEAYMAYVQAAAAGHKNFMYPYLFEYKDVISPIISVSEIFLGKIVSYTGIAVSKLFMVLKFLCPAMLFLLFYWLVYAISKNKISALLAPSLIIAGMGLPGASFKIASDMIMWRGQIIDFFDWIRLINPAFSGIFFILALVATFYLFVKPTFWRAAAAGLALGALFYIYLYFWTFILTLLSVLFIYALFLRNWRLVCFSSAASVIGVILGIPAIRGFFGQWNALASAGAINNTVVGTHAPMLEKMVLAAFALFIIFIVFLRRRGELKKEMFFPFFLLAASVIVVNQQIITGKIIQPHHYYFFTNLPSAYVALAVIFGYIVNLIKQKYIKYPIVIAVFLLIFSWGVGVQASSYNYWHGIYGYYQNYGPAIDWLKSNADKDSVIYSDLIVSDFISAYTPFFVYWVIRAGDSSYPPMERRELTYFIQNRLNGLDAGEAPKYFREHRSEIGGWMYGQYYRDLCGSVGCFPEEIMNKIIADYTSFLKQPFGQEFKKYKLDYFIWDKNIDPKWRIDDLKFLEQVFEYKNIIIYKVK